jgi:hypothetical protein
MLSHMSEVISFESADKEILQYIIFVCIWISTISLLLIMHSDVFSL